MNNINSSVEECNFSSSPNEIKILIKQLNTKLTNYYNDTNKSLLEHDHKISELCNHLKDNLSDSIRSLIDNMIDNGEIDEIVRRVIFNNTINVKDFRCYG